MRIIGPFGTLRSVPRETPVTVPLLFGAVQCSGTTKTTRRKKKCCAEYSIRKVCLHRFKLPVVKVATPSSGQYNFFSCGSNHRSSPFFSLSLGLDYCTVLLRDRRSVFGLAFLFGCLPFGGRASLPEPPLCARSRQTACFGSSVSSGGFWAEPGPFALRSSRHRRVIYRLRPFWLYEPLFVWRLFSVRTQRWRVSHEVKRATPGVPVGVHQ